MPERVIDAAVSDGAFHLYCLLLRYGNGSGCRMPSRQTLARRLRRSVDAVDRAMRQLTEAGIVRVEHRRAGEQFLSNRYHVRTTPPAVPGEAAQPKDSHRQTSSPTTSRRGRSAPTPVEEADDDLLDDCGITDLNELAQQCMTARRLLGKPTAWWTARCLAVVIKLAVVPRGWPTASMEQALLAVARDREDRSPARVAEAGPWWTP